MRIVLIVMISFFTLFASTEEALKAYKQGEYDKAFKLYMLEAKKGDTIAMNALSYLYFEGIGTKRDEKKSLYYLEMAAEKKDPRACLDLGLFYLQGERVAQKFDKAAVFLQCAVDGGNIEAKYNLALMYYNGDGVKQDVKKAAALLEEAAISGHKRARANVGRIYMQALDFKKAKEWLKKNAEEGDKEALLLLKEIEATNKE